MPRNIRILYSHSAYARYLPTLSDDPIGMVESSRLPNTPYSFSSHRTVWSDGADRKVVTLETRHKRYEVWEVSDLPILPICAECGDAIETPHNNC